MGAAIPGLPHFLAACGRPSLRTLETAKYWGKGWCAGLVALLVAGCGGDKRGPSAREQVTDAGGGSRAPADGGLDPGGEADASGGGGPVGPPDLNPLARRLLPSGARLVGLHESACAHGPASAPANADAWCAFIRPGPTAGALELWVLNVTSAANTNVSCEGSGNQDCLRLTDNLFGSGAEPELANPSAHRFFGDTLIYYADAVSGPNDDFQGPAYAWQPGWTAGRAIASDKGLGCSGHPTAPVAMCLENLSPPSVEPLTVDLHAGPIAAGPLPRAATITPLHPEHGYTQWASGFSPQGDRLVFSNASSATGNRETLYTVRMDDVGRTPPTQLGEPGISRWALSADGLRVFYLREYNYDGAQPSGSLFWRNFPDGPNELACTGSELPGGPSRGVGVIQVLSDAANHDGGLGAVVNLVDGMGEYRILKDPAASANDPLNVIRVATGIASLPVHSPDLRFSYVAKAVDGFFGTTDAWIMDNQGRGGCSLTEEPDASIFGLPFTPSSSLVFWASKINLFTQAGEGWVANPAGCAEKRKFSESIDFWFLNGDQSLLYSDDSDGRVVTLRQAPIAPHQLGTPVVLQGQVHRMYAVLPGHRAVLFQLESGAPATDGIYYLPLSSQPR